MPPGFEQGPIRPPSEAYSLLLRVTRNCPWKRCAFCPVYKSAKFSRRSREEVLAAPSALLHIPQSLPQPFPSVNRVTTYARAQTLSRRAKEELTAIREAGLNRIHVGLESGSDKVLEKMRKGVTAERQILAGQNVKAAGLELSEYVMPGLGGKELWREHAIETARALNALNPDSLPL